jgi:acetyl-CoA acetyltransferase
MRDVAVVAYCRTRIAKARRGARNQTHGIPMTAHVLRHAVKFAGIDPGQVEDVIIGCGLPEGATRSSRIASPLARRPSPLREASRASAWCSSTST